MSTNNKSIPIIINPASGKPRPMLHTISETFRAHNMSWRGHLTYKFGDATQFAQEAVADGAEMVVVAVSDQHDIARHDAFGDGRRPGIAEPRVDEDADTGFALDMHAGMAIPRELQPKVLRHLPPPSCAAVS